MKLILTPLIIVMASTAAFAQAGSIGGTVGKQDKSISGGGQAPTTARSTPSTNATSGKTTAKEGALSVAGRWRWAADCQSGHWTAGFQIAQGPSGQISGSLFSDPLNGSIEGRIANGTISFTRSATIITQHWTGQISEGGRHIINGSITGNENCTWEARKE